MEPYCQKHNTSNLVFSPRPAAVLSTPAVALRKTPLLCRTQNFFASLFADDVVLPTQLDQWIRRQDRSFAATLPSCRSSGRRQTPASLCAVTCGPIAEAQIAEAQNQNRRTAMQIAEWRLGEPVNRTTDGNTC
jgi:hypothetical protein